MPPTWVAATYDGAVRALLLGFKERNVTGLAAPLGDALARSAAGALLRHHGPVLVVPIPSASAAVRQRGDDVVRLLAARAARQLRTEGHGARVAAALTHRRRVRDSAGLSASARAVNLADALEVRRAAVGLVRRTPVLLVDDLVTTGATISAASAALAAAGARVLGAAAVAATQRRSSW
jgi:predicted amidophosphoribosyltransferase